MSEIRPVTQTDTKTRILDSAERLFQTRGYNAISYADIANELGIKKASIHYYFPTKADLGSAVVERYAAMFERALNAARENFSLSARQKIEGYFDAYRAFAADPKMVCLCGALAGEFIALPEPVQKRASAFFLAHQVWLEHVLTEGMATGEFRSTIKPDQFAKMIMNGLQGALLIKRATNDSSQLEAVVNVVSEQFQGD